MNPLEGTSGKDAAGDSALSRCIACGVDAFSANHWGRAPLLSRAAELADRFDDLLDAAAVDELVSRRGLRTPFLRMAKDGSVVAAAKFTRGGGAGASIGDQAADDRILAMLADGATLVLQALHRVWPPLIDFASRLSAELGHPVQVNAYVTPPQNQGFDPHYDVHDVFVLQVSGSKHWTIHEPIVFDPLAEQPWQDNRPAVASRATEPPVIDTVLAPGDALYLPRGTIHSAKALGETSIHLTVGIHPVTRHDLLRHLLDTAKDEVALRRSLPMGVDLSDPDVVAPQLSATVDALRAYLDTVSPDQIAQRVGSALMRDTRPEPLGPLAQLELANRIDADTVLRLRGGLRVRVEHADTALRLHLLDRTIDLSIAADAALKTILSGVAFAPRELSGLDAEEQVRLVAQLLREGVLVPVG